MTYNQAHTYDTTSINVATYPHGNYMIGSHISLSHNDTTIHKVMYICMHEESTQEYKLLPKYYMFNTQLANVCVCILWVSN